MQGRIPSLPLAKMQNPVLSMKMRDVKIYCAVSKTKCFHKTNELLCAEKRKTG